MPKLPSFKVNNNIIADTPFSKINAYPSNTSYVIKGDGSMGKVTNANIDINTLNINKLVGCDGSNNKYLCSNSTWKTINAITGGFDNSFSANVDATNF